VIVREYPISRELRDGDYEVDCEYRARLQRWLNTLWSEKDVLIGKIIESHKKEKGSGQRPF